MHNQPWFSFPAINLGKQQTNKLETLQVSLRFPTAVAVYIDQI